MQSQLHRGEAGFGTVVSKSRGFGGESTSGVSNWCMCLSNCLPNMWTHPKERCFCESLLWRGVSSFSVDRGYCRDAQLTRVRVCYYSLYYWQLYFFGPRLREHCESCVDVRTGGRGGMLCNYLLQIKTFSCWSERDISGTLKKAEVPRVPSPPPQDCISS